MGVRRLFCSVFFSPDVQSVPHWRQLVAQAGEQRAGCKIADEVRRDAVGAVQCSSN